METQISKPDYSALIDDDAETSYRSGQSATHHHRSLSHSSSIHVETTAFEADDAPNILETSFRGHQLKVYKRRWYILGLFSLMAFMQGGLINSWSVITPSAEEVFNWTDKDISIMQVWVYISYLVAMLPFGIATDKLGLRYPVIVNCLFMVVGCAMRCVITHTTHNLWLATVSHFLIGAAGVMAFTAGPIISALWFPANQRATATAVSTIAGYTGGAGCFLFGPLIVDAPTPTPISPSNMMSVVGNMTNIDVMRNQIMICRYIEFGIIVVITLAFFVYFPSKPSIPPTITTAMGKLDLLSGCRKLFSKELRHFWLICFAYGTAVSIYGVWNGLLGVNLKNLMSVADIGWLGFASVMAGSVMGVIIGRLSDFFVGRMKMFLVIMVTGFIVSTFWFILLAHQYIAYSSWQLMFAGILQGLFNNGGVPLYYELAIESTYPVSELSVTGMMTFVYNVIPLIFLVVFLFPNVGTTWMDWVLLGAGIITFPILLLFKEQYRRSVIDKNCAFLPKNNGSDRFEEGVSGDVDEGGDSGEGGCDDGEECALIPGSDA